MKTARINRNKNSNYDSSSRWTQLQIDPVDELQGLSMLKLCAQHQPRVAAQEDDSQEGRGQVAKKGSLGLGF